MVTLDATRGSGVCIGRIDDSLSADGGNVLYAIFFPVSNLCASSVILSAKIAELINNVEVKNNPSIVTIISFLKQNILLLKLIKFPFLFKLFFIIIMLCFIL
jgi:hypothetical protein